MNPAGPTRVAGDVPDPVPTWPAQLQLVRHGESAGNVARDEAMRPRLAFIEIVARDMDVPLSSRCARSRPEPSAVGSGHRTVEVVLASPYVRAEQTAGIATDGLEQPRGPGRATPRARPSSGSWIG